MKEKGPYNIDLQYAVKSLYGRGIIEQDSDIAEKVGYSKGTVSSYINGKTEMSINFKESFEKVFKLKLADFARASLRIEDVDQFVVSKVKKIEAIAELLLKLKAQETAERTKRDAAVVEQEYWRTIEGMVASGSDL